MIDRPRIISAGEEAFLLSELRRRAALPYWQHPKRLGQVPRERVEGYSVAYRGPSSWEVCIFNDDWCVVMSDLNHALQSAHEWDVWLRENPEMVRKAQGTYDAPTS